jgi:hypothetical protein
MTFLFVSGDNGGIQSLLNGKTWRHTYAFFSTSSQISSGKTPTPQTSKEDKYSRGNEK